MKIRGQWKESYEEAPPGELDARIRAAAHRELAARRTQGRMSWLFGFWRPVLVAGALGALSLVISPEPQPSLELVEMMRERELLEALPVLRAHDLWEQVETEAARGRG